ncbi:MAG: DUF6714 family protein [Longimicrobiales bacterium]
MKKEQHEQISRRAFDVFRGDAESIPPMTLRGGDAVDNYDEPPAHDPAIDNSTDEYLDTYAFTGLAFLDAASWRHYLPSLIDYALRNFRDAASVSLAIDGLLYSLRPPDRDPPRLGSLSSEQEAVIVEFLDTLAFGDESTHNDLAMQVLEEYWVPGALYRKTEEQ